MAVQFMDEPRKTRTRQISKSDPNRTGEARAVLRIEQGERRIDLLEFWRICRACGASFDREVLEFARAWKRVDSAPREGPRSRAKGKGKGESLPLGKGRRCGEERGVLACERPS